MKTSNNKKAYAFAVKEAAAAVLAFTLLFTACPNNAGGGGTPYVQVPYGELRSYLKGTASADKVNYIEVTGPIPKDDFKNTGAVSRLGNTINRYSRKVALKIETYPSDLTDMGYCFYECTNLISLANLPASVTSMYMCFNGCTKLTGVKLKCDYNPGTIPGPYQAFADAFKGCTALTDGGIKVPAAYYDNYTGSAALTTMQVPGADTAAQKAKFAAYNP